jgi:hypothetical protein
MKKLAHKQEIAEWYAQQVMEHWQCPYDEIEWLVENLKEDAMQIVVESYYENQKERRYGNRN